MIEGMFENLPREGCCVVDDWFQAGSDLGRTPTVIAARDARRVDCRDAAIGPADARPIADRATGYQEAGALGVPAKSTTRVTRRLEAPWSRVLPASTWRLLASP